VHATQFFEFVQTLADSSTVDGVVRMPPAYFQPMAAVDVAEGVAIAAVGDPVNGITEIGGPQAFRLPDLIRTALVARGDTREVVADRRRSTGVSSSGNAPLPRRWRDALRHPVRGLDPRSSRQGVVKTVSREPGRSRSDRALSRTANR